MRRLAIVFLVGCGTGEPSGAPPPPTPVDVVALAPGEVVDATEYLATLRSRTAATIQPQVDGQITQILVKPGDVVAAGQPLVQIDPGRQPAAVAGAIAARGARQAALALAEKDLERVKRLVADGALPGQELDNAKTAVETARAELAGVGAEITSNQTQLRYYKVVAPSRGVVGDIPARIGDRVTPQTVLTTVTDNATLEANVSVPVDRARELGPATRIDIVDASRAVVGTGTTKFVSAQVSPETQSVLVKADVDNSRGLMRSDQIVRARVVWNTHPGFRVPALAVTRIGGQAFVYVAEQHGPRAIAKQRPVKLGDLVDNTYVVLEGVRAGERIATSNLQKLRDGAPIQPKG